MIFGPFSLHPGVIWVNESTDPAATQQITRTVLNTVSVYSVPVQKLEIILEAKDSGNRARGYFTREQFEYIKNAEKYTTTITMIYRGVSRTVIVKAGGVDLTGKMERESVEDTDIYTGTVILQEV